MEEKMDMNVLSIADIKAMKIEHNTSAFETLTEEEIAVATKKLEREIFMRERFLEKLVKKVKVMREKILKQLAAEEDEDQVRSFINNRPRRSCFTIKQILEEEEDMKLIKEKKKRRFGCTEATSEEDSVILKKRMRRKKDVVPTGEDYTPDLPEEFNNVIATMGGSDVKLIIQKKLFATDVKPDQGRLSIPISQIKNDFLTDAEKAMINSRKEDDKYHLKEIEVRLIDPCVNEQIICLRKWDMKKSSGSYTSMYVLAKSWNEVVWSNKLKENNILQLWSFRVGTELCFALVKVERGREKSGSSSSKSRGNGSRSSTIMGGDNGTSSRENTGEGSSSA